MSFYSELDVWDRVDRCESQIESLRSVLQEITHHSAPLWLDGDQAFAWADGWNAAVAAAMDVLGSENP